MLPSHPHPQCYPTEVRRGVCLAWQVRAWYAAREGQRRAAAATRLQARQQGNIGRRSAAELKQRIGAALVVQSSHRAKFHGRRVADERRRARDARRRQSAATRLQAEERRRSAVRVASLKREQHVAARTAAEAEQRRCLEAAEALQRAERRRRARRLVEALCFEQHAILTLQRHLRGMVVRRRQAGLPPTLSLTQPVSSLSPSPEQADFARAQKKIAERRRAILSRRYATQQLQAARARRQRRGAATIQRHARGNAARAAVEEERERQAEMRQLRRQHLQQMQEYKVQHLGLFNWRAPLRRPWPMSPAWGGEVLEVLPWKNESLESGPVDTGRHEAKLAARCGVATTAIQSKVRQRAAVAEVDGGSKSIVNNP